ncbi:hypothetical protein CI109_105212 [Kwoniella shandongensis]|uniref:Uncharacterized protein n=1 Tax=Kwoniella shandongensis TaxID=1734106 RepID=A0A5M6C8W5_9TREE|nr:uncharacterized protein CI109_002054 [Kwoniella shandongensis]KAA5529629.1 hypothetical protein CI109_002054 [Kwoniella shandongensis]
MSTPISFTVRPPPSSTAPFRPSPLGNGGGSHRGPPSRRLFEQNGDDDDDDDGEGSGYHGSRSRSGSGRPRDERIEGFGGNGKVLGGEKPAGPLVIAALPNKDWRQSSSRRVPTYRPDSKQTTEPIETHERVGDEPQRAGIRNLIKTEEVEQDIKVERIDNDQQQITTTTTSTTATTTTETEVVVKTEPLTLEQQALQAILQGDVKMESEEERLRRELVIDMHANADRTNPITDDEAFKRDVESLPEESTIDDYAAIPVSAFGEAMARGMGWKPTDTSGTKIHEPKLRPALLGLGATALEKPLPPSRAGSSSSKRAPKVSKRDSMKYVMSGAMVKKESSNGSVTASERGTVTPGGSSRRGSPESSEGKRRRDDDYDGRDRDRDGKRRERDSDRYRDREYETEEERAKRKAKERERRDRDRDRYDDRDRDRDRSDRRDDRDRRDGDRDREGRDRDRDRDRRDRDRDSGNERYSNGDRERSAR